MASVAKVLAISLFVLFVLLFVASWVIASKMTNLIKKQYPSLWRQFGFPGSALYPKPEEEDKHAKAQIALHKFLRSQKRRELGNDELDALVAGKYWTSVLAMVFFFAAALVAYKYDLLN